MAGSESPWSPVARLLLWRLKARRGAWSQHKHSRLSLGQGEWGYCWREQGDRLRPCQPLLRPQNRQQARGCDCYNDTTKLYIWEKWALCIHIIAISTSLIKETKWYSSKLSTRIEHTQRGKYKKKKSSSMKHLWNSVNNLDVTLCSCMSKWADVPAVALVSSRERWAIRHLDLM